MTYFVEQKENETNTTQEQIILGEYRERLIAFLAESLDLEKIVR